MLSERWIHYAMRGWVRFKQVCVLQTHRANRNAGGRRRKCVCVCVWGGHKGASSSLKVGQLFPVKLMDASWGCYWQLIRKQLARNISSLKTDGVARNERVCSLSTHPPHHHLLTLTDACVWLQAGEKMVFSRTDQSRTASLHGPRSGHIQTHSSHHRFKWRNHPHPPTKSRSAF